MQHMTELPRLAEADGVFFITLAKGDRASIATTIHRLIDMLDAMDGEPDLEDGNDDEPNLGRLETIHQGGGSYSGACEDSQGARP